MTHAEKVEYMKKDLALRGVGPLSSAPPLFRLLWALGIELPPPLFLTLPVNVLLFGGVTGPLFGIFWTASMWLALWQHQGVSALAAVTIGLLTAVFFGLFFGLGMGLYMSWKRGKLNLPSWADYPAPSVVPVEDD